MTSAPIPPTAAPESAGDRTARDPLAPLDVVRGLQPSTTTMEMPVYVPGEWMDERPRDVERPTRGLRPRRRSTVQRVFIWLSSGTALLVLGGVLALATILSPIGARRAARAAAEQELRAELDDGEKVLARAFVSQRNWWDNFRESFGVLAATDRRLIFVGLPPASWIRSRDDDGPPELRVQSFPYDAPFKETIRRQLLYTTRGVVVQTTSGAARFLVPREESDRVREIARVVERAQIASSAALELEQRQRTAPPPPPTVYGSHTVKYGESVIAIARRYRTTPAAIRELNRLPNDNIRAGQHLRVPQPRGADSAAAPTPAP